MKDKKSNDLRKRLHLPQELFYLFPFPFASVIKKQIQIVSLSRKKPFSISRECFTYFVLFYSFYNF